LIKASRAGKALSAVDAAERVGSRRRGFFPATFMAIAGHHTSARADRVPNAYVERVGRVLFVTVTGYH